MTSKNGLFVGMTSDFSAHLWNRPICGNRPSCGTQPSCESYIFIYKKGSGSLYEACSRLVILPQTPHFYMVKLGVIRDIYIIVCAFSLKHMSRVMRKPAFCIRENKDADQLQISFTVTAKLISAFVFTT